jgi:uncharacterized membrane protein HdeD (DUF308 family)
MKNNFADLTSLGLVSTILGLIAVSNATGTSFVSPLLGFIGIILGVLSIRAPKQEKLEQWSAWLGMVLSTSSIIWSLEFR